MGLLKSNEEKELIRLKKEKAENDKKIIQIEAKEKERQAVIDANERKYQTELTNFNYRCESYLVNQPCFDRLVWFIAFYGGHQKKYTRPEWSSLIKTAGLSELEAFINKTGAAPEQPPVKQVIDPLKDD